MISVWPAEFSALAPAGYYVALRVGFAFPRDERNEYPAEWVKQYTEQGLMLRDPVVRWVYENTGMIRWSQLEDNDPHGVFAMARKHGLRYGLAISHAAGEPKEERTYGSFSRSDREFRPEEMLLLESTLRRMHDGIAPPANLTPAELQALKLVKEGLRLKEIAFKIGVSEGAIKQRLAGAKKKLGARTNSQAATMALEHRLI